jgi:predicted aspartyl protease
MSPRVRVVIVLLAAMPVFHVHAGAPESVPFRLDKDGAVVVPVSIDGRAPVPFLLDTGANGSSVCEGLATELALPPVARTSVVTSVGSHSRVMVRLGRVSLGDAQALDLLAAVMPAFQLEVAGVAVQGILGQDFLSGFNYTLDYRRRRILWIAPGERVPAGDEVRLTLRRSEGRFLVELPQEGERIVRFVPDSGTNGLVVFDRPGAWALPADPLLDRYEVSDLSGRRAVEMRRIRALRIGHLTLRDQVAAVVSKPQNTASEGDGLLPLHLFASVTFESREGYLVIRVR